MARIVFTVSLALVAMLAAANAATADDKVPAKPGFSGGALGGTTMTLGGKGTAASAKAAPDTELAWYHGYFRGYNRGFYNGFYSGWGGYYSGFYPAVYPYAVGYSPPVFYPPVLGFYGRFGGISVGLYGINGTGSDLAAPAVSLNLAGTTSSMAQRPSQQAPVSGFQGGAYRYDWNPANPVPLPKQESGAPNGQATPVLPPNTGLPVSLPKTTTQPTKPYAYKGYGEK
jgi:hypothetical protein